MGDSKKRKKNSGSSNTAKRTDSKRPKRREDEPEAVKNKKKKQQSHEGSPKECFTTSKDTAEGVVLQRDAWLASKKKTEVRKKKKIKQHNLEKKLAVLWEKFRTRKGRKLAKEYRSKKVSKALHKAHGNIHKFAVKSRASSRILQDCLRFGAHRMKGLLYLRRLSHIFLLFHPMFMLYTSSKHLYVYALKLKELLHLRSLSHISLLFQ